MKSQPPLVSILCTAFNQEKYIRDALDGFLMQKTNFPFEVLINDDASTDKTPVIIKEYQAKYPDIIKPLFQKTNQYNRGISIAREILIPRVKGKYIAICEGDDYWTDENKLQKQVDFMEKHPDYSVCFHPVRVTYENEQHNDEIFPNDIYGSSSKTWTLDNLLSFNFIQTNSVIYRSCGDYSDIAKTKVIPGDWFFHIYHARHGKIGFINDTMAVYRRHDGGIWSTASKDFDKFWHEQAVNHMNFFNTVSELFAGDKKRQAIIKDSAARVLIQIAKGISDKDDPVLSKLYKDFPNLFQRCTKFLLAAIADLENIIVDKDKALSDIVNSKKYKIGRAITAPYRGLAKCKTAIWRFMGSAFITVKNFPKIIMKDDNFTVMREYFSPINRIIWLIGWPIRFVNNAVRYSIITRRPNRQSYHFRQIKHSDKTSPLAVVVHLFFTETWDEFASKLKDLSAATGYDLFVTIPQAQKDFSKKILRDFPQANIFTVANRGRDVLPFILVGKTLIKSSYEFVLKVHSKKSTHATSILGKTWRQSTLDSLIGEPKNITKIMKTLRDKNASIIGPSEYYYSLDIVSSVMNIKLLKFVLKRINCCALDKPKNQYGFFAGTMFWARLDAIAPLITEFNPQDFPAEKGQLDATMAHALERAFTILPELCGKEIYACSQKTLVKRNYKSLNVPPWLKRK